MWLRNLPQGEDQTVNSLPQEYVRALFDTAQSANVAHSKIAEGLQGFSMEFGLRLANPIFPESQVLRYNTGSAVRAFFGRQDQLWTLIHGQEGEWEAQGLS